MGRPSRPMFFVTLETGCMVCLSHLLNADGYLRKRWPGGLFEMFHRTIFRAHKGEIPEGHEVDHMCKVRACCNPDHLQALPRTDHLVETNQSRYRQRYEEARVYWLKHTPTGVRLAELFGVSFSTACGWVRQWRPA